MDVVTSAVTRIGSCIAAALKIEETLSELSEWPFLVELVRGYKGDETDEEDHDDVEGVFDDECKMFKDLRDVWIDRLANVAIGKSCDALMGTDPTLPPCALRKAAMKMSTRTEKMLLLLRLRRPSFRPKLVISF